jgi:hypothetical protein
MERNFSKWTVSAAMVFMLCMAGLIVTGTAFSAGGQQCVDNEDGTITDKNTGLMWQKATAGPMNWNDAKGYAYCLSLAGHSDWRLPTKDELKRLYKSSCKGMMDVVSHNYWSSTRRWDQHFIHWFVNFSGGWADYISDTFSGNVRAVRNAQ